MSYDLVWNNNQQSLGFWEFFQSLDIFFAMRKHHSLNRVFLIRFVQMALQCDAECDTSVQ